MEKYDVIIIGAGPAGLSAGIYASRANLNTLIIENASMGGKLSKTHIIENYPGIKEISGMELADQLTEHGQAFGAKVVNGSISSLDIKNDIKKVIMNNGNEYESSAIIIATGTKERQLQLDRADEFTGQGVSYCAVCDGFFYRKKSVVVIGGGNSALEESLFLADLCEKVTIVIRRDQFRAEAKIVDKVLNNPKIEVVYNSIPNSLVIDNERIQGLEIKDINTNEVKTLPCVGIFPYIGADPCTELLPQEILDDHNYIKVNSDMSTSIKGVYGAGDVVAKELRQVVTACNDGAIAANSVIKSLK